MSNRVTYIFIYNDEIYKYNQILKLNSNLSRYEVYKYIGSIANNGLNRFMRDRNIDGDFKIDFIVWFKDLPYCMYAERTTKTTDDYLFRLEPIIKIVENNKFSYNDIVIANTYRCNDFSVPDDIIEFKIIDDGINNFDDSHSNLLDNLPFSVEKVYLLYNVKTPVTNLPFSIKKVYVYENCDTELLRLPFDCELVKINPNAN
jgi:hypothetical protein